MTPIDREDIQIISRNSNWSENHIDEILKLEVYSDKSSWQKFLQLFLLSLGVSFMTAGILFFFAYNWEDLHKFIKLGLIEGLIISTILIVIFSKLNLDVKHVLLTGASILVGVLFAVFGQIYQTGANAYDFFLGWTLFITIWVLTTNFAPIWLVFITLINTTFVLYTQQVAHGWSEIFIMTILFVGNLSILVIALIVKKNNKVIIIPIWFTNVLALATVCFSTIGICMGIFDGFETISFILLFLSAITYVVGVKYGLEVKSGFYLSVIPFSIIIIISTFLMELSDEANMFLFISLFVIMSVTFVIKNLINLQKKWTK